jgi:hypothetical protein
MPEGEEPMTIKVITPAKAPAGQDVPAGCASFVDGLDLSARTKVKK